MNRIRRLIAALPLTIVLTPALAHPPQDDHGSSPARHDVDERPRFITNRHAKDLVLPDEEDAYFFIIFGDRTGGPAEGVEVLTHAIDDANLLGPDLVMTVGDLIEGYNQRDEWIAQMREYISIMDGLNCRWFPVAGNHDIYWRGPGMPPGEHEGDYETHFGPLWYAFRHKNCWFIVLYSDEGNPETGRKNFSEPESQRMSDEQFNWLAETLNKTSDARHVFVFLHHPRWIGGNYGSDWNRVHQLLAVAGNVTAVFAGHIHRMRYDGPRNGIEYVTLATTGGSQSGRAPDAGYLHHFHVVTVRDDRVNLAAVPVGEVLDVRGITGLVSHETSLLSGLRPRFESRTDVSADGAVDQTIRITVRNPVSQPIDVTLGLESEDSRWVFTPDHNHRVIAPGKRHTFKFGIGRSDDALDDTFRPARYRLSMDYLTRSARYSIPAIVLDLPAHIHVPTPQQPAGESVLVVDGSRDCAVLPSDLIDLPNGPLTVECWFNARRFGERVGLLTKTEDSEYGIFVSNGVPQFYIHLDGSYVEAIDPNVKLSADRWYHIAGVYDGTQSRLYIDGELIASVDRSGDRRRNALPLVIGADVNALGEPMSFFDGMIDGVRISAGARYTGSSFAPARRPEPDSDCVLLLNMDGGLAHWIYDESGREAHPRRLGDAHLLQPGR